MLYICVCGANPSSLLKMKEDTKKRYEKGHLREYNYEKNITKSRDEEEKWITKERKTDEKEDKEKREEIWWW